MAQRHGTGQAFAVWGAILAVAGLALLLLVPGTGGGFGPGGMMPPGMMPGFGPGGASPLGQLLTVLAWLLLIGGLVLLGVWLVRRLGPEAGAPAARAPEEPLRIAEARYARGEISREEYERLRQDLSRAA